MVSLPYNQLTRSRNRQMHLQFFLSQFTDITRSHLRSCSTCATNLRGFYGRPTLKYSNVSSDVLQRILCGSNSLIHSIDTYREIEEQLIQAIRWQLKLYNCIMGKQLGNLLTTWFCRQNVWPFDTNQVLYVVGACPLGQCRRSKRHIRGGRSLITIEPT